MEGGKSCVAAVMVLLLIMPMMGASARLPLGGGADVLRALVEPGKQKRVGSSLSCCDDCRFSQYTSYYTCYDSRDKDVGCDEGCEYCSCGYERYATCICMDYLYSCPPLCNDEPPVGNEGSRGGNEGSRGA